MGRPPRDPHAAARAREFLDRHVGESVSLDDLARAVGLSRDHVIRLFRRTYGVTPFQYRRRLRLRHAGERLRERLQALDSA